MFWYKRHWSRRLNNKVYRMLNCSLRRRSLSCRNSSWFDLSFGNFNLCLGRLDHRVGLVCWRRFRICFFFGSFFLSFALFREIVWIELACKALIKGVGASSVISSYSKESHSRLEFWLRLLYKTHLHPSNIHICIESRNICSSWLQMGLCRRDEAKRRSAWCSTRPCSRTYL